MGDLKLIGYIAIATALGLGVAIQFMPAATAEFSGFGAEVETDAMPWGLKTEASTVGAADKQSDTWFEAYETADERGDDTSGLPEMQAQMVLGYAGLGFGLLGLLVAFLHSNRTGSILAAFGFVCMLVAVILFAVGTGKLNDAGSGPELELAVGFYLMIAATVTMLGGATLVNRG